MRKTAALFGVSREFGRPFYPLDFGYFTFSDSSIGLTCAFGTGGGRRLVSRQAGDLLLSFGFGPSCDLLCWVCFLLICRQLEPGGVFFPSFLLGASVIERYPRFR